LVRSALRSPSPAPHSAWTSVSITVASARVSTCNNIALWLPSITLPNVSFASTVLLVIGALLLAGWLPCLQGNPMTFTPQLLDEPLAELGSHTTPGTLSRERRKSIARLE